MRRAVTMRAAHEQEPRADGGVPAQGVPPSAVPPHRVTVVRAPACHLCEDAQDAFTELGGQFPLDVELVAAESARGAALVRAHRVGMFPLVLLDGAFFSAGRLPRRKLRDVLARSSGGTTPQPAQVP